MTIAPEKNYIRERLKKGQQRAKLLSSRPDFQQDIARLREKWDIPQSGIKEPPRVESWYKKLYLKNNEYVEKNWPKTREKIIILKEKGTMEDFQKAEQLQKKFNKELPINDLKKDIGSLVSKYKKSPQMHDTIQGYLICNAEWSLSGPGVTIHESFTKDDQIKLFLTINEHTTLRDIKAIWPSVKMHQAMLPYYRQVKQQPILNFDRDQRAYELQLAGKSHKEIAAILKDEFRTSLIYSDIGKIIERHKKRLGMN